MKSINEMRIKWHEWLFSTLSFIIFLYAYSIIAFFGLEDFMKEGVIKDYMNSNVWHVEVIISGILLGILFVLINQLTENRFLRRKSFGLNIIIKSVLYLTSLCVVGVLIYYIFLYLGLTTQSQLETYKGLISTSFILSIGFYLASILLLMNFLIYINKKLGPRTLIELIMGKYYHPREEELIFMFLDLKDSTTLAEKLGHNNYSRFLKDCFHELTSVIKRYNARIYQYVGDEVVLYWTKKEGFNQLSCLHTYFAFNYNLDCRKDYFISKYGQAPQFKAGIDTGLVTGTEIGDIKREIAFHGDVLNTASRLEKKCNEHNVKLIISQNVKNYIITETVFHITFLNDIPLKGKTDKIKFYGVDYTTPC